ncbi:MAG TPA: MFS transporter [Longimicrobium sp.]|nr:MFS transporter [Longimicrobium sp.]
MKLTRTIAPGMRTYATVWAGQLVSMIGSSLTEFGVAVWVFQTTGSATAFGAILLFGMLPGILVSIVAGAAVDRWDRRRTMILADTGAAVATLTIAIGYLAGSLELWHVCAATAFSATMRAFQQPAWAATTSLLVPEEHLGRASGLMNFARSSAQIAGPLLGGVLVLTVGLGGVILIDFATFGVAVLMLMAVRFPPVPRSAEGKAAKGSLLREAGYGWKYIARHRPLRVHLGYFTLINMGLGFVWVLFPPLVLSFTNPAGLGTVGSFVGFGMLAGSTAMTVWGGPRRRVRGILGVGFLAGACVVLLAARPSAPLVAAALFGICVGFPILNGCFFRIWLPRIPADLQGRTIAAIQVMAWSAQPIAYLSAGPLADRVFKPLMMPGGALAGSVGAVIGTGPGRGIALLLACAGLFVLSATAVAALIPDFRNAEDTVPLAVPQPAAAAPAADESAEAPGEDVPAAPAPVPA